MNFNEELNNYFKILNCSSKDLAIASGLSSATISRYRNTDRVPTQNSSHIENLAIGIEKIAKKKNISKITKDNVLENFKATLSIGNLNFEQLRNNFNFLIDTLEINVSEMAKALNFDPSYISRIRTGNRIPANPESFVNSVCNFIAHKYTSTEAKSSVALFLNCSLEDILDESSYYEKLRIALSQNSLKSNNEIDDFLQKLDTFNLDEYIKVIHFDELKVPNIPFYKHSSRTYYGIEKMKQAELDFFKSTVLSKSDEDVFMYSDMPMEDMAEDIEFDKKWMFAIAMTIKKGLNINIIHNLDRPFNELMLGLESWIPIYMTGQVSPYYLTNSQSNIFSQLNYVSGKYALNGECVRGFHNDGKYYLTGNADEVSYYKKKAKLILNKANSLMDIYTSVNENFFKTFIFNYSKLDGDRKRFLASLPIATISGELLFKILKRNKLSEKEISNIIENVKKQKEIMNIILKNNTIFDKIPKFSKTDFENSKINLFLSTTFCDKQIHYTYEEYLEHLDLTKKFADATKNYSFEINPNDTFRNIQITILKDNCVIISKNTEPPIHFVIKHPKLRNAIENFIAPVVEN
jgi:transcriptional regulator with XRE-family HTH domain